MSPYQHIQYNSGNINYCKPDWSWDMVDMPDMDIWLVCDGSGFIHSNAGDYRLAAGNCLVFHPGIVSQAYHDPEQPLTVVAVHYDYLDAEDNVYTPVNIPRFYRQLSNFLFVKQLLIKSVGKFRLGQEDAATFWLQAVLREIEEQDNHQSVSGIEGEYLAKINEICDRIVEHPQLDYNIADFAKTLSICPDHFSRLFDKFTGMSPKAFIIHNRIEFAKNLLLNSNYNLSQIAEQTGYSSLFYFSKQFKAKTGQSPSRFRYGR